MNPTCIPADTNGSTKFAATLSGANTEYAGVDFDSGYSGSWQVEWRVEWRVATDEEDGRRSKEKEEGGVRRKKKEE